MRIARCRAGLDWEEGRWLLAARRARTDRHLGFGGILEYAERLFGYEPRVALDRLRVAEALENLPRIAGALRTGVLCWSAVREVTRVARPETECDWIAAARDKTARQVELLVAGLRPGQRPGEAGSAEARRHVVRLDMSAEAYATFREAVGKLRRESGGNLDDDEAVLLMARMALGGPRDEGRASYQIAVTVCSKCAAGWQDGRGEPVAIGPEVVERARCDAQFIGETRAGAGASAHVGTEAPHERATQTIPPAVRRLVMRRDHGRCVAPGCRNATFVDVHHVRLRSEGGDHDPDNLIVLCAAHHAAVHAGTLAVEGSAEKLVFKHADGTRYGTGPSAAQAEVFGQVFGALRHLGFGEAEARARLRAVRAHMGTGAEAGLGLEAVLRAALYVTAG